MQVFVVSLDRSAARREVVSASLREAGVPFEIARAVDGRGGEHHAFTNYCERTMLERTGRTLSPGEVGCFASHYRLWQVAVELGQPIAVIEDDIVVAPDFATVLALAATEIEARRLIRLFAVTERKHVVLAELASPFQLIRYLKGPYGTQAYVVSPAGAKALLDKAAQWLAPVDRYLDSPWLHGIDIVAMKPFRVSHGNFVSEIERCDEAPTLAEGARRGLDRLQHHVSRAVFNLSRG